jgi:hypothetical protein
VLRWMQLIRSRLLFACLAVTCLGMLAALAMDEWPGWASVDLDQINLLRSAHSSQHWHTHVHLIASLATAFKTASSREELAQSTVIKYVTSWLWSSSSTTLPRHQIQVSVSDCQGDGRASSFVHVLNCYSADPVWHHKTATRMAVTWMPTPFLFWNRDKREV